MSSAGLSSADNIPINTTRSVLRTSCGGLRRAWAGCSAGWARKATPTKFSAIIKTARCASILRGSANGKEPFSPDDRKAFEELADPWLIPVIKT